MSKQFKFFFFLLELLKKNLKHDQESSDAFFWLPDSVSDSAVIIYFPFSLFDSLYGEYKEAIVNEPFQRKNPQQGKS